MREIKFRGCRRRSDQWSGWHYGDLWHEKSGVCVGSYEVDPDTVGQFTGLLDRNGKEIYEGDIIECATGRICKVYYFMSPCYCGFDLLPVGGFDCEPPKESTLWKDLTVIGNVYDNPELLEVKA